MKNDIVQLFKYANTGYLTLEANPEYTFLNGEEEEFASFIDDYINKIYCEIALDRNIHGYHVENDTKNLLIIFLNSALNLDYEKLWKCIDKRYFCDDTTKIFDVIFNRISFESFEKELSKINDYKLVYNYYIYYGKCKNIPLDEMMEKYFVYLSNYINQSCTTVGKVFTYFFNYITCVTPFYKGNVEDGVENAKLSFDKIVFDIEISDADNESIYPTIKLIEAPTPMFKLVKKLLSHIDLNYEIRYNHEIKQLRDVIPCELMEELGSKNFDWIKDLLRDYLSIELDKPYKEFNTRCFNTNTLAINMRLGNVDEVNRIVNSDDFKFCSKEYYDLLKEKGSYMLYHYSSPDDVLGWNILDNNFVHQDLLNLLLNDKIFMLDISVLRYIKEYEYLTSEEFNALLNHIKEKSIMIYSVENRKVSVVKDIRKELVRKKARNSVFEQLSNEYTSQFLDKILR